MTSICRTAYNLLTTLSLSFVLLVAAPGLQAQGNANPSATAWPVKPVRIVVPFSPGGNTDAIARISAERLGAALGQQFIVENRVGAAGMIATEFVARAAADGYTLIMATGSQVITAPFTQKISFDPVAELAPIAVIGANALVITVPQSLPVNNLREFVDYAKARPGQLNYGSGGSGTITHLSAALFVQRAGLEMTHVPYKGGGPALADVVGGQIQLYSASPSEVIAFRGSNKVKLLGISSEKRNARLPEVPAIAESYPGHVADTWNGLMAPAKTPPAVIERISRELQKAMSEPAFVERIEKMGLDPVRHTPQEFAESIRMQVNTWREVIRKAGIKPE
jgi:tripartite-type tricarboxylate transporter receptor subunit TctC